MELFQDSAASFATVDKGFMVSSCRNGQLATVSARAPLKVVNGPIAISPSLPIRKPCDARRESAQRQAVSQMSSEGIKSFGPSQAQSQAALASQRNFKRNDHPSHGNESASFAGNLELRLDNVISSAVENRHHPSKLSSSLEQCPGPNRFPPKAATGAALPKIETGTAGSCLDAYSQLQPDAMQKRQRRPKQPTVIMKPKYTSEENEGKPIQVLQPSGVLGELKPGIIGRIRDSRHIHSIIGAVIGSVSSSYKRTREVHEEKLHSQNTGELLLPKKYLKSEEHESESLSLEGVFRNQLKDEEIDMLGTADSKRRVHDAVNRLVDSDVVIGTSISAEDAAAESCESIGGIHFQDALGGAIHGQVKLEKDKEDFDDNCTLMRTYQAAGPASQWFELLSLDIKGRISALKRSRRRVRTAIVAKDEKLFSAVYSGLLSNQYDDPEKCKRQYELQMDRWKALFVSMDAALGLEAANLENRWSKVQEMQSQFQASGSTLEDCLCNMQ